MNKNQETERDELTRFLDELQLLKKKDNFRTLPTLVHQGKEVIIGGTTDAKPFVKRLSGVG